MEHQWVSRSTCSLDSSAMEERRWGVPWASRLGQMEHCWLRMTWGIRFGESLGHRVSSVRSSPQSSAVLREQLRSTAFAVYEARDPFHRGSDALLSPALLETLRESLRDDPWCASFRRRVAAALLPAPTCPQRHHVESESAARLQLQRYTRERIRAPWWN